MKLSPALLLLGGVVGAAWAAKKHLDKKIDTSHYIGYKDYFAERANSVLEKIEPKLEELDQKMQNWLDKPVSDTYKKLRKYYKIFSSDLFQKINGHRREGIICELGTNCTCCDQDQPSAYVDRQIWASDIIEQSSLFKTLDEYEQNKLKKEMMKDMWRAVVTSLSRFTSN